MGQQEWKPPNVISVAELSYINDRADKKITNWSDTKRLVAQVMSLYATLAAIARSSIVELPPEMLTGGGPDGPEKTNDEAGSGGEAGGGGPGGGAPADGEGNASGPSDERRASGDRRAAHDGDAAVVGAGEALPN